MVWIDLGFPHRLTLDFTRKRAIWYVLSSKEKSTMQKSEKKVISEIQRLQRMQTQVWVRVRPIDGGPHWRRAAVLGVLGRQIRVKPIKHGGREEVVPAADVKLWKAMNSKQPSKET